MSTSRRSPWRPADQCSPRLFAANQLTVAFAPRDLEWLLVLLVQVESFLFLIELRAEAQDPLRRHPIGACPEVPAPLLVALLGVNRGAALEAEHPEIPRVGSRLGRGVGRLRLDRDAEIGREPSASDVVEQADDDRAQHPATTHVLGVAGQRDRAQFLIHSLKPADADEAQGDLAAAAAGFTDWSRAGGRRRLRAAGRNRPT